METIDRLEARAFRGVKGSLALELSGKSVVVFGDNGTGKSTIADAVEWYLTGAIEFLAHEGRRESLRHVGAADGDVTTVVLGSRPGDLSGEIALPAADIGNRPELTRGETYLLRGRTLAEFIDSTKGEKWKALAQLLGLEEIEGLVLDAQSAKNGLERERKRLESAVLAAAEGVEELAGRAELSDALTRLQQLSAIAGINPPGSCDVVLSGDWLSTTGTGGGEGSTDRSIDIGSILASAEALTPLGADVDPWNETVGEIETVELNRLMLFQAAQYVAESGEPVHVCPLCDTDLDPVDLRTVVRETLLDLRETEESVRGARRQLDDVIAAIDHGLTERARLKVRASEASIVLDDPPPSPVEWMQQAKADLAPVDRDELAMTIGEVRSWDDATLQQLRASVPTGDRAKAAIDAARLAERTSRWATTEQAHALVDRAQEQATTLYNDLRARERELLETTLATISDRVADLYGKMHSEPGVSGIGIEPWGEKGLELAVDFHGGHYRPPHSVLSESHLNSLAIAVFLAMAEAFNERIGFLVLDDVVNSLDSTHRRALAEVLVSEFDSWQLVVLTHDHVLYEQLRRRGSSWKRLELTSWDFDEGPRATEYRVGSMLEKAEMALVSGDSTGSAMKGRRALEELLQEICEGIGAPLPFRRGVLNDRREIGELTAGVRRGLKAHARSLYSSGAKDLLDKLDVDVTSCLNVEAHSSPFSCSSAEVGAALARVSELDGLFTCSSCTSRVFHIGSPGSQRCRCGASTLPPPNTG